MAKIKTQKRKWGSTQIILILSIVLSGFILKALPETYFQLATYGTKNPWAQFSPEPPKDSLQLYSFPNLDDLSPAVSSWPTMALGPQSAQSRKADSTPRCGIADPHLITSSEGGNCCVEDGPVDDPALCCSGVPYCDYRDGSVKSVGSSGFLGLNCGASNQKAYPAWCNRKPIIYLYPKIKTKINVQLQVPGYIYISIPEYPAGGWKNIEAYPDGTLIYENKKYRELYYESDITRIPPPDSGIIVASDSINDSLKDITTKLGLNSYEQKEFLEYWIPGLKNLNTPYIQISVFDSKSKAQIDKVNISPAPDTFIEFIMYFKGLEEPISIKPLSLPEKPPSRIGFTAVEWGGIIDNN